ncbi:4-hydroxyphenylpyruvate dioxygenase [Streptomyces sp. bgisy084]|uniref:4-hydroxyphenylpyruvate dioxygenase n=1 Tax=Streptomyces sp. bgisy084 TaxID=3413777 RepID=UPI003D728A24
MSRDPLTDQEQPAGLDLDQFQQLVDLVEYDESTDLIPVNGWDAIVFVVGNATQAAHYYQSTWGMELVASSGPENGNWDHKAFVLQSGSIRFVLKGAVGPDSLLADHHAAHGDSVIDISLEVPDVDKYIARARRTGTSVLEGPYDLSDEHGVVRVATIATHGETRHTLVQRLVNGARYAGPYLPGYKPATSSYVKRDGAPKRLFHALDHIVSNVELGKMDEWVGPYHRVMGFVNMAAFINDVMSTDYVALMSKVIANGNHRVKFPRNDPAIAKRTAQSDAYLERHRGPGAQHLALATNDILRTVDELRKEGMEFLSPPDAYYEDPELRERIGKVRVPIEELQKRGILVDHDEDGYLLQIFTRPLGDRPTVFFELIERHGSFGFGNGNFKALFESIEREQERRGNL